MSTVLITRFSALGDIALAVPLVRAVASTYPGHRFLVLSQPFVSDLFAQMPPNLAFIPADLKGEFKGLKGMLGAYRMLKSYQVDVVCDLHGVLRTHLLDVLFGISKPVYRVKKERNARRSLVRRWCKKRIQLSSVQERYRDVFRRAGFEVSDASLLQALPPIGLHLESMESLYGKKEGFWLGLAPFARHEGKRYPLSEMERVVEYFASRYYYKVFIFGGGQQEVAVMNAWKQKYPSLVLPGNKGLGHELKLMNCLDGLLTMDSANMHLGALANTKVLSVWGATHPLAGFAAWNQPVSYRLQSKLSCRPCSIYGKKPCYRKDHACMTSLSHQQVISFIVENIRV